MQVGGAKTVEAIGDLVWFLQTTQPITVEHYAYEQEIPLKTAWRRLHYWRLAGLAVRCGCTDSGAHLWRPTAGLTWT